MSFLDNLKQKSSTTWRKLREGASEAMDAAQQQSEAALKSLKSGGHYSKTDFLEAYCAAGALMAGADGDLAQEEYERVRKRMSLHPILKLVSESNRDKALADAFGLAEEGMVGELVAKVEKLTGVLFDENGNFIEAPQEQLNELQAKCDSIIAMAVAVKDDDGNVSSDEVNMLEAIVYWLGRDPAGIGMREDLLENPPHIAHNYNNIV